MLWWLQVSCSLELLCLLQVLELKFVTFGNLDRQHDVEQNGDQKIIIIIRLKNDGIIRLSWILFSGYRFFKFMLFLAGFLVGFVFTYLLCSAHLTNELSGNALKYKEQVCNCHLNVHSLSSHSLSLCLWEWPWFK